MHGARAKMAPGGGGNIKVVVRVRPFNGRGQSPSVSPSSYPHKIYYSAGDYFGTNYM